VGLEQLEHLPAEHGLQVSGAGPVGHLALAQSIRTADRGGNVKNASRYSWPQSGQRTRAKPL
jgi:hypothetical protein